MIETTTDAPEVTRIKALVHGDTGIGKTTSLKTLPPDITAIVLRERGTLPLRLKSYKLYVLETWDDVRDIVKMFQTPVEHNGKEIKILAVDSLTEVSDLCKRQIVRTDRRVLISERTKGARQTPANAYDDQMTQEDWGLYRTRMHSMLSTFCHLPINVIFTAMSQWQEDKRTGELFRTPALDGKLARECGRHFDLLLHMESAKSENGEDIRVWRTFNSDNTLAKDASGILDPFEPADWAKLFGKILTNGNGKAKKGAA